MSRGRAHFCNHGRAHRRFRRPNGYPLLRRGTCVAADRNDPDVLADECLPFVALAEADVQPEKLHRLEVIEPPHSNRRSPPTPSGRWQRWLASERALPRLFGSSDLRVQRLVRFSGGKPLRDRKFADSLRWREMDSNFRFRARGAIDLSFRLSSKFLRLFVFCQTNIRSRPRWRLLSSCTRTPNGRLATGGGRDSLSAALTSRE